MKNKQVIRCVREHIHVLLWTRYTTELSARIRELRTKMVDTIDAQIYSRICRALMLTIAEQYDLGKRDEL